MPILNITYRYALPGDLDNICKFVDFWLAGKARQEGIDTGGTDFFLPRGQHKSYIKNYKVLLAMNDDEILGWAVMQRDNTLIHLLINGDYRGRGIGKSLLHQLNPDAVRSKTDQSTGNPNEFYNRQGYTVKTVVSIGRNRNIDVLKRPTE